MKGRSLALSKPTPNYIPPPPIDQLTAQEMSEDDAAAYVDRTAGDMKVLWIHDLELEGKPKKPGLPLVH